MLKPFEHQTKTTQFILNKHKCLITSDPGTGKTRSVIDAYSDLPSDKGRMLVIAPLSILQASWGDDIEKFQPNLGYSIAYAKNRKKAFEESLPIVLTNHDAVKWIIKNPGVLEEFNTVCIDEFTAFKNKDSQRSKAIAKIMEHFEYRIGMSGTPNSNSIVDIWHPAYLIDDGERLGRRFYSFRNAVCTSRFNGFANEWVDRDDAEEIVASALLDINIRYSLEECIDMPEQTISTLTTKLPKKVMDQYSDMVNDSVLHTDKATINAVHAGAKVKKLLQMCTGALYDNEGNIVGVHEDRYNLVLELVQQRPHSLVAFNWSHEKSHMVEECEKRKIKYGVIDGSTAPHKRNETVDRMQAGQLQVVFCHPQSAGHGLTMTTATSVIWASPTYNAEHYQQFNRRIYRAGQTKRTEVIRIAAEGTWEPDVYAKLEGKLGRMEELLTILNNLNKLRKIA
jgi:SNF2 family DNA or RNA helicase